MIQASIRRRRTRLSSSPNREDKLALPHWATAHVYTARTLRTFQPAASRKDGFEVLPTNFSEAKNSLSGEGAVQDLCPPLP